MTCLEPELNQITDPYTGSENIPTLSRLQWPDPTSRAGFSAGEAGA